MWFLFCPFLGVWGTKEEFKASVFRENRMEEGLLACCGIRTITIIIVIIMGGRMGR